VASSCCTRSRPRRRASPAVRAWPGNALLARPLGTRPFRTGHGPVCCPVTALSWLRPMSLRAPLEVLNAQEVAQRVGVTERTVRRWIESGRLNAEKRGRSFAIRLTDVEHIIGGSSTSRATRRALQLEEFASQRDHETAELRGRYLEIKERLAQLEAELAAERRRAALLEAQLVTNAA
jgi:excisionase family DNA binding protein